MLPNDGLTAKNRFANCGFRRELNINLHEGKVEGSNSNPGASGAPPWQSRSFFDDP